MTAQNYLYSADEPKNVCPRCGRARAKCNCASQGQKKNDFAAAAANDGIIRIRREVGGRGGKTVTAVAGVPAARVEELAGELKKRLGTGGTVNNGVIEFQGDHRERIKAELEQRGLKVKLAGG